MWLGYGHPLVDARHRITDLDFAMTRQIERIAAGISLVR